jgi:hypothetical protein
MIGRAEYTYVRRQLDMKDANFGSIGFLPKGRRGGIVNPAPIPRRAL